MTLNWTSQELFAICVAQGDGGRVGDVRSERQIRKKKTPLRNKGTVTCLSHSSEERLHLAFFPAHLCPSFPEMCSCRAGLQQNSAEDDTSSIRKIKSNDGEK